MTGKKTPTVTHPTASHRLSALVAAADGTGVVFPVLRGRGSYEGTGFGAKSGLLVRKPPWSSVVGLKVGSYWARNREAGIPAHGSTTLLLDDETGYPRALINAKYLNGLRTAAANAVACDLFSRPDSRSLCVFGSGGQAAFEIEAVRQVRCQPY